MHRAAPVSRSDAVELMRQRLHAVADGEGRRLCVDPIGGPLIGRVVDGEPLAASEQAVARGAPDLLLDGLGGLASLIGSDPIWLAVRRDRPALVRRLRETTRDTRVRVVAVPPRYPADEASLLGDLAELGQVEPAGPSLPGRVIDAIVLRDVGLALRGQWPASRWITIAGAVARPGVLEVPLGTSVAQLVELCGGATVPAWRALLPGAAGRLVDAAEVVGLDTRGFAIVPHDHPLVLATGRPPDELLRRAAAACVHCRVCTDVCPVSARTTALQPHAVMRELAADFGGRGAPFPAVDDSLTGNLAAAAACDGCGVCTVLCPAGLRPSTLVGVLGERLRSARGDREAPGKNRGGPAVRPRRDRPLRRLSTARVEQMLGIDDPSWRADPIVRDARPGRIRLPLRDPRGDERIALVSVGQRIGRGDPLLRATGAGVDLFAPAEGLVTEIDEEIVIALSE